MSIKEEAESLECCTSDKGCGGQIVRVWDLPTRIFHWALFAGVVVAFVSVKLGGNAMVWHGRAGSFVLSLLIFRLLWGFVGSKTSKFSSFVKGPSAVLRYLRNQPSRPEPIGHNPLGALSVIALLGLFLLQALSGLGVTDDIFFEGPLVQHLSSGAVALLTTFHKSTEPFLLGLLGLHLVAIGFYRIKKGQDLVTPMFTGKRLLQKPHEVKLTEGEGVSNPVQGIKEDFWLLLRAIVCWGLAWLLVLWAYDRPFQG